MSTQITNVVKRSGAVVPFNKHRITHAIYAQQLPSAAETVRLPSNSPTR